MRRLLAALFVASFVAGCQQILGDYTVTHGTSSSTGEETPCDAALDQVEACGQQGGNCSGFNDCALECYAFASCDDIAQAFQMNMNTELGECVFDCEQ
jgi:hypothetical protein